MQTENFQKILKCKAAIDRKLLKVNQEKSSLRAGPLLAAKLKVTKAQKKYKKMRDGRQISIKWLPQVSSQKAKPSQLANVRDRRAQKMNFKNTIDLQDSSLKAI